MASFLLHLYSVPLESIDQVRTKLRLVIRDIGSDTVLYVPLIKYLGTRVVEVILFLRFTFRKTL